MNYERLLFSVILNLTPLQKRLLRLLGMPVKIYLRLTKRDPATGSYTATLIYPYGGQ